MKFFRRVPFLRKVALLARRFADAVLDDEDAASESSPAVPHSGSPQYPPRSQGPPAHWLADIAAQAPHLVENGELVAASFSNFDLRLAAAPADEVPQAPANVPKPIRPAKPVLSSKTSAATNHETHVEQIPQSSVHPYTVAREPTVSPKRPPARKSSAFHETASLSAPASAPRDENPPSAARGTSRQPPTTALATQTPSGQSPNPPRSQAPTTTPLTSTRVPRSATPPPRLSTVHDEPSTPISRHGDVEASTSTVWQTKPSHKAAESTVWQTKPSRMESAVGTDPGPQTQYPADASANATSHDIALRPHPRAPSPTWPPRPKETALRPLPIEMALRTGQGLADTTIAVEFAPTAPTHGPEHATTGLVASATDPWPTLPSRDDFDSVQTCVLALELSAERTARLEREQCGDW